MAKTASEYRLRIGHQTTFRRTIVPEKGEPYQLVFEPDTDYELSDEEIAGLDNEIRTELLVPVDHDEHGRQRVQKPGRQAPIKVPLNDVDRAEQEKTAEDRPSGQLRGKGHKGTNVGAKSDDK